MTGCGWRALKSRMHRRTTCSRMRAQCHPPTGSSSKGAAHVGRVAPKARTAWQARPDNRAVPAGPAVPEARGATEAQEGPADAAGRSRSSHPAKRSGEHTAEIPSPFNILFPLLLLKKKKKLKTQ